MRRQRRNQLKPEFQSTLCLNPFGDQDSASRKQMYAGNMPQALSLITPTRRRTITGSERDHGKYCFTLTMPCDANVIEVINRVEHTVGHGSLKKNPETVIIYEDIDTGEINYLCLPKYHSLHKRFGFRYKYNDEAMQMVYRGSNIPRGTQFAKPVTLSDKGEYMYGREARIAFMTLPPVIEDGAMISESFANSLATHIFEERVVSWGKEYYALNLYGDPNHPDEYKVYPDIGEKVRDDGILVALRRFDDTTAPVEMTPQRLRQTDRIFDKFIRATPGAEVVDVKVHHNDDMQGYNTPVGMEFSPKRYDVSQRRFYNRLLDVHRSLEKSRGKDLNISRALHRMLREAAVYINPSKEKRKLGYRKVDLDDWRVTITLRERVVPGMGFKLSDGHGGKGVVCQVTRDEDMPRDQFGIPLDLIMDPMSLTKRMNMGRVTEPRINSTSMMLDREIREALGLDPNQDFHEVATVADAMDNASDELVDKLFDRLMGYYKILSPRFHDLIAGQKDFYRRGHVAVVAQEGTELWLPTDNDVVYVDVLGELAAAGYHPNYNHVQIKTPRGKWVPTKKKVMVGSIYIILLEKIGRDWSAVASAKLQINGVPSRISSTDRYSSHGRLQPVRIAGETEVRLFLMAIGGVAVRDLLDQSNNPASHRQVIESILLAQQPTNIESVIDRERYPTGDHRIIEQIRNLHMCGGIEMVNLPA